MEILWILWPLSGIIGHIVDANRSKTWCGTPVWEEPLTYAMFFPAMIIGPIVWFLMEPAERH